MSIHAADALMEIFGFKRVANDEKPLDNPPPLDDDSGSLNEGMKMEEVKNEGLEVAAFEVSLPLGIGRKVYEQEQAWANHNYGSGIVYHVEPLCRHSEALAGYAERDARISELEKELSACATAVDNCELFRVLIAELESAIEVGKRLNSRQAEGDQDE